MELLAGLTLTVAMLPFLDVCDTWEDRLWAHFKHAYEEIVDVVLIDKRQMYLDEKSSYLAGTQNSELSSYECVKREAAATSPKNCDLILKKFEDSLPPGGVHSKQKPWWTVQMSLMKLDPTQPEQLKELVGVLQTLTCGLSTSVAFRRFAAHLVLYCQYKLSGLYEADVDKSFGSEVIETYVNSLFEERKARDSNATCARGITKLTNLCFRLSWWHFTFPNFLQVF
jgi:hypothetical protein